MKVFADERKRYVFLMGASIIFGIIYVLTSHMDYLMNMIEYRALTLTNFVYSFFRFECVILPVIFVVRRNAYFPKILMEKVLLGAFAVAALAGVMWSFDYLNYYTFRDLLNEEYMYLYQAITSNYIAVNRLMWGTTSLAGIIFSLILSIMYFMTALLMHKYRKIVVGCFTVIFLFRVITPITYICIAGEMQILSEWFIKNLFWVLSALFMTLGIWSTASSDDSWMEHIWGEELQLEFEDEDE
ncbi:MAG: hypothetical protein UIM24_02675 [Clostridia bacterium]|nr:hypothetical protein [Clostridia bacterium]